MTLHFSALPDADDAPRPTKLPDLLAPIFLARDSVEALRRQAARHARGHAVKRIDIGKADGGHRRLRLVVVDQPNLAARASHRGGTGVGRLWETLQWLQDHGYSVRPARQSDQFHGWRDGWIIVGAGQLANCCIDADTRLAPLAEDPQP